MYNCRYYKQNLKQNSQALVKKSDRKLHRLLGVYKALGWAPKEQALAAKYVNKLHIFICYLLAWLWQHVRLMCTRVWVQCPQRTVLLREQLPLKSGISYLSLCSDECNRRSLHSYTNFSSIWCKRKYVPIFDLTYIFDRKARDVHFMKRLQAKWQMKLSLKANKFQKHYRAQVNF